MFNLHSLTISLSTLFIHSWIEKLPLVKSPLESTWLYHEIGRCHLELGNYQDAREFGEKSLDSAAKANDDVWQLNASVLIAQADGMLQIFSIYHYLGTSRRTFGPNAIMHTVLPKFIRI